MLTRRCSEPRRPVFSAVVVQVSLESAKVKFHIFSVG